MEVAESYGVSRQTVWRLLRRVRGQRLDRAELTDRKPGCAVAHNRVSREIEDLVVATREWLAEHSALGEYGDQAIHVALTEAGGVAVPSVRTIARILARRGVIERGRRVRRPAPPRGWYLPEVASGRAVLDSIDVINGLSTLEDKRYEVLTATSHPGRVVSAWPMRKVLARNTVDCLLSRWRELGLPRYAQFDNDTRFQGDQLHPDSFGLVVRVCMSLGVVAVFSPPREHGLQNGIESFNGLWQRKVLRRMWLGSLAAVIAQSAKYVAAHRERHGDVSQPRGAFPGSWDRTRELLPRGRVVFVRRIAGNGTVHLLSREYLVNADWAHLHARCVMDLDRREIRFFGLRRSQHAEQPLLNVTRYDPPLRPMRLA